MTHLVWDAATTKTYETGVDHGVLYPVNALDGTYPKGVAWNGLTTITESPSGAEATALYADNIKYLNLMSAETFGGTIEAYTYPDEFMLCDGTASPTPGLALGQQNRQPFGLSYRTVLGNDAQGNAYGYKLHLVYGCVAQPSERAYGSINDSPAAITFSWAINTTPLPAGGSYKPVSTITIDSRLVDSGKLATLESILYGAEGVDPRLPLPEEVISILQEAAPSALSLSSIVPAHDATGVAVDASVVLTFNNKVAHESVVLSTAAGVIVSATKTWDATGKILTIDPATNLAGSTTYHVTISGVVDVYNSALTPVVKSFATV